MHLIDVDHRFAGNRRLKSKSQYKK